MRRFLIFSILIFFLASCDDAEQDFCVVNPNHIDCVIVQSCLDNQYLKDNECLDTPICTINEQLVENECVEIQCEFGEILTNGICEMKECKDNEIKIDGECFDDYPVPECGDGEFLDETTNTCKELVCGDNQYILNNECVDLPICNEKQELGDDNQCKYVVPYVVETKQTSYIGRNYSMTNHSLDLYNIPDGDKTNYVEVSEFLDVISRGISSVNIHTEEKYVVSFIGSIYTTENLLEPEYIDYLFEITFDAELDSISINHHDLFNYFNKPIEWNTGSLLTLAFSESSSTIGILFNLDMYEIDIHQYEDDLFIPFYLANLLLTGPLLEMHTTDDLIYITDPSNSISDVSDRMESDSLDFDIEITPKNTEKYMKFYFDYFYGLKEYYDVESFSSIIDTFNIDEAENPNELNVRIDAFIKSLDDPHTSIIFGGTYNIDFEASEEYINGGKTEVLMNSLDQRNCKERDDSYRIYEQNNITHVELNGFSSNVLYIIDYLDELNKGENVILDLTCNTGGQLNAVLELLVYMYPESIAVNFYYPKIDETISEEYFRNIHRHHELNYTVLTSEVTYSAANLFVSIFKDYDLGVVVGSKTSGGGSPIEYEVLPNGATIVYSSPLILSDNEGVIIEDGIEPHVYYEVDFDQNDYKVKMLKLRDFLDYQFLVERDVTKMNFSIEDIGVSDVLTNISFEIIINELTSINDVNLNNTYYYHFEDTIEFYFEMLEPDENYHFVVNAIYDFQGVTFIETLYSEYFDRHVNTFDENTSELIIGESITLMTNYPDDLDAFYIDVTLPGYYEIKGDLNSYPNFDRYDNQENFKETGLIFYLSEGRHYFRLSEPCRYETVFELIYIGSSLE